MKSHFVELLDIGKSHLNVEDIDTDNLQDNEAIIKGEYSLISAGTELSRAFGLKKGFKYPVRPGYSMVGRIIDKGKNIDINIGDRVFVNCPHTSIVRWKNLNSVQDPFILKLDDDINPIYATIINLGLVALQGVNLTDTKLGYNVGVFGLGNLGILTALMYKKLGLNVIGLDPVENRCMMAKNMGIENVISDKDQKHQIDVLTDNKGLDIAVDVTGLSPVIIEAVRCTKHYGQVLLLGSPRQSYETDVTSLLSDIHMKNLKLIGGFNRTVPYDLTDGSNFSMKSNYETVCALIANKDIDVSMMISEIIDPKDCEKAYYDLMYNKDKVSSVVFDWSNY